MRESEEVAPNTILFCKFVSLDVSSVLMGPRRDLDQSYGNGSGGNAFVFSTVTLSEVLYVEHFYQMAKTDPKDDHDETVAPEFRAVAAPAAE